MSTTLRRTVAPTVWPVSLEEAMTQCRQTDYSDEVTREMSRLIAVATEYAESVCRQSLITQTREYTMSAWPDDSIIRLPRPPLQSVTSITYVDIAGTTQTWNSSNYRVITAGEIGKVVLAYSQVFPTIRSQEQSVTVTYVAGYGDAASDVPELLRQAILSLVVHWYDYRGEILAGISQSPMPLAAKTILLQERCNSE
jgi:uncharacterized phiE125 gp8 family phage protein